MIKTEDAIAAMGLTLVGMTVQTETLAAGSAATATLSGNVLTLGIPRGADGAKGAKGDTGRSGVTFTLSGTTLNITTG